MTNGANVQKHHIAGLTREAVDNAWNHNIIASSWASSGLWPANPDKVFEKKILTRFTTGSSEYANFTLVNDPLPLARFSQRSLRQLTREGIDINAYRAYSVTKLNLNSSPAPPPADQRIFIDVKPKRLLTHDDCMAELRLRRREREEEERQRIENRAAAALRKIEKERLKEATARKREEKKHQREADKLQKAVLGRWKRLGRAVKKVVAAAIKPTNRQRSKQLKLKTKQMETPVERRPCLEAALPPMTLETAPLAPQRTPQSTGIGPSPTTTSIQSLQTITAFCDI